MKNKKICSAYDSILPSGEAKEELLQKLLAAAPAHRPEGNVITMKAMKRRCTGLAAAAAVLVLILSCTAMAYTGVLGDTFGLWLGEKKVELDKMAPVTFDLENYLEEYPGGYATFQDYSDFTKATGMTLAGAEQLRLTNLWVDISERCRTGHMGMDIEVEGETAYANGMFLLKGNTEREYGYGVEASRAHYVYEYEEGRKAYFIKDGEDQYSQVYFMEDGVMYQLTVDNSQAGKELGKKIVDRMAGLSEG